MVDWLKADTVDPLLSRALLRNEGRLPSPACNEVPLAVISAKFHMHPRSSKGLGGWVSID